LLIKIKQAQNFINHFDKHCDRIVNYQYYWQNRFGLLGAKVESAAKQIDRRTKISGACSEQGECSSALAQLI